LGFVSPTIIVRESVNAKQVLIGNPTTKRKKAKIISKHKNIHEKGKKTQKYL